MAKTKLAVGIALGVLFIVAFLLAAFVARIGPGLPELALIGGVVLLFVANLALIVGAIVHALVRDDLTGTQRLVWIAIAFFITPVIALGAIVYFVMGRKRTSELFRDVAATS